MNKFVYRLWHKERKTYIGGSYWGGGRHTYMTLGSAKNVRTRLSLQEKVEIHEFELVKTDRTF